MKIYIGDSIVECKNFLFNKKIQPSNLRIREISTIFYRYNTGK